MPRASGHRAGGGVFLLVFLIAPDSVRADVGPRFEEPRILVRITRQGMPLSEPFEALLLKPQPTRDPRTDPWQDSELATGGLSRLTAPRSVPQTARAGCPLGTWGSTVSRTPAGGLVAFHFRPDREPVPFRVRVALHLPQEQRVVVTTAAPTRPYVTELTVDLAADGTGSLEVTPRWPVTVVLGVLSKHVPALGLALLATVVLEVLVVAACAWIWKRDRDDRLYGAVVLGNLITVPLVWFVSIYGKVELTPGGWPVAFLLAELTAAAFEGWLYYSIAKVPIHTGLIWSALANGVTLLARCCLVAFTV
jgi:hypothetical protein